MAPGFQPVDVGAGGQIAPAVIAPTPDDFVATGRPDLVADQDRHQMPPHVVDAQVGGHLGRQVETDHGPGIEGVGPTRMQRERTRHEAVGCAQDVEGGRGALVPGEVRRGQVIVVVIESGDVVACAGRPLDDDGAAIQVRNHRPV